MNASLNASLNTFVACLSLDDLFVGNYVDLILLSFSVSVYDRPCDFCVFHVVDVYLHDGFFCALSRMVLYIAYIFFAFIQFINNFCRNDDGLYFKMSVSMVVVGKLVAP